MEQSKLTRDRKRLFIPLDLYVMTWNGAYSITSVQFSHSVVFNSFWPHESQHTRPPCPSPTSGVHSDSRPSSQWCHPAISSSVIPFSSCPQSLPASESFPMSQLFSWGDQSTGVSALASLLPRKSQGWSPSERTGWISLQSKGLSRHRHINTGATPVHLCSARIHRGSNHHCSEPLGNPCVLVVGHTQDGWRTG